MCVSVSVTEHGSEKNVGRGNKVQCVTDVEVPFVQEAIFYGLERGVVEIVITGVIENRAEKPINAWFIHEGWVSSEDLRDTLAAPTKRAETAAIAELLSEVTGRQGSLSVGELPEYSLADSTRSVQFLSLPEGTLDPQRRGLAPFLCVGFGPLGGGGGCVSHVVRFGISIRGKAFERIVRRINGTRQYFYGINGPGIVLEDIWFSYLPGVAPEVRKLYKPVFEAVVNACHVPIRRYEVVTFDPADVEDSVRYNRGLAEALLLLENRTLTSVELGKRVVNAWRSVSERFVILRGSMVREK
jgi:hypothetical protein